MLDPIDENRLQDIRLALAKEFQKPLLDSEIQKYMPGMLYRRHGVIHLTKLNGTPFMLNAELIETVEETPDTVISLVTGRKYLVKESIEELKQKCLNYKREIYQDRTA